MSRPTPSTIDAFWLALICNIPDDTSNVLLDITFTLPNTASYSNTPSIDAIVPLSSVYKIPFDDVNAVDTRLLDENADTVIDLARMS